MKRRDFLKLMQATGVVIPYWSLVPAASAQTGFYTGKVLINVHASGGMDQSSWTDPRPANTRYNQYAQQGLAAVEAGNLRAAPMGANATFFQMYFQNILVINGVNSETNSHEDGTRAHATGMLAMNYPNLSEVFAHRYGMNLPFPWLNAGGPGSSGGLVAATTVPSVNALRQFARPNAQNATTDFMKQADLDRVLAARAARLEAMKARGGMLPLSESTADQFLGASASRARLAQLEQFIPAQIDQRANAHVALIAAQAGITSTIQLSSGGFDTHSNHPQGHNNALTNLTGLLDYLVQKSAQLNISNRILIRVYSEFGRVGLNNSNGKDHWSVGSQILIDPAGDVIGAGNRVFGASGVRHDAQRINTQTGAIDPTNGVVIRPRHIHAALQARLNFRTTDPRFDLRVPANEMFNFFDPSVNTGYPNLMSTV